MIDGYVLIDSTSGEVEYAGTFSTRSKAGAHVREFRKQTQDDSDAFFLIRPELDVPDFALDQWQWDGDDWRWLSETTPEPTDD